PRRHYVHHTSTLLDERPFRDFCPALVPEHRWLFKKHDVSWLAGSSCVRKGVSGAQETCERIIRCLCRLLHYRIRQECCARDPCIFRGLLSFTQFPGEVVAEVFGSQIVLLQYRVTQLAAENFWPRERSPIGPPFFLVERTVVPKF